MTTTEPADPDAAQRWRRVDRLAHVMDEAVRVPGTQRRVGVDGLVGMVPGIGDAATFGVAGLIVVEGVRLGARGSTIVRMLLNVALDALMGTVPVVGWLSDFVFKANSRNVALLRRHALDPDRTRAQSRTAVALTVVGLVAVLLLVVAAAVGLVVWLTSLLF